jgi:leader peptidase (prepilin peptidase)/N-methyltransferase
VGELDLPAPLYTVFTLWLVFLGLAVGSFLNVVIARLPNDESIVRPRSRCPKCGHPMAWYENIPVASWVALGARCKSCKAPISWRYPLVEALTAVLYFACLRRFGWTLELAAALVMVSLLVALTFIDLDHWILPFELTIPGIVLGLGFALAMGVDRLILSAVGAALAFFLFWFMEWFGRVLFKKEAMGGGDKYLLAMLGAFLTYKALLGVILLSSIQAVIVGLTLIAIYGRAGPAPNWTPGEPAPTGDGEDLGFDDGWKPGPTNIPLGPWLALAGVQILLLGPWIAENIPYLGPLISGLDPYR